MEQSKYLKELHKTQIEILDEIDRVCKENDIKYFLIGGTLLGAVRHKGFIPWDDDVDIGMLREDYEKKKKICLDNKALSNKYFLHCFETDNNYYLPFIKVRKNNTTFNEKMIEKLNTHKGIFVDIFPFENVNKLGSFFNKLRAYFILNACDAIKCKLGIMNVNNCRRKYVVKCLMVFNISFLHKFIDNLLSKKCRKKAKYACCIISGSNPFAEYIDYNKSFPLIDIDFENNRYPCFNNYDIYLKSTYGDYMQLPPEDKRITHMPVFVSFKKGKNMKTKRKIK